MLSIQEFVSIVNTFVLLLILRLALKLCRAVQNREPRPAEDNRQPVALARRRLLREEWNNSAPCTRKRATEQDEF